MDSYQLPFAQFTIIKEDLAEVTVAEGVELNLHMLKQSYELLQAKLNAPFSLLINKVNSYSYSFETQMQLPELQEINAVAVLTYDYLSIKTIEYLASLPSNKDWNLHHFSNRQNALVWLQQKAAETAKIKAK
ncbi:hypothetical protein [Psychromonas aquimarina]|uniref:hypothetical protein n=1 Tax=Psychromonas aquimarina TaxID=444919 RepID=UPI0003F500D2|nr:hypothetical protein [Psychromonas aquimarina]